MTEVDKYLQEKVLDEKIHLSTEDCTCQCHNINFVPGWDGSECKGKQTCCSNKSNRDFSTPTDSAALEAHMRKKGEWVTFIEYMAQRGLLIFYLLHEPDLRAELIAEYYKSKEQ